MDRSKEFAAESPFSTYDAWAVYVLRTGDGLCVSTFVGSFDTKNLFQSLQSIGEITMEKHRIDSVT